MLFIFDTVDRGYLITDLSLILERYVGGSNNRSLSGDQRLYFTVSVLSMPGTVFETNRHSGQLCLGLQQQ